MRLLYITDALAVYGGIERVLTQKVNWFVEHNYEVCVLTVNQGNNPLCYSLHPNVSHDDLDVRFYTQYRYSGWRRFIKRKKLNRVFRKRLSDVIDDYSPDIIICTHLEYVYCILSVKGNIPLVFESHSSCLCDFFENDSVLRRLYMWRMKKDLTRVDMVVALTDGDAREWRNYSSHVCVIPDVVALNSSEIGDCSAKSVIFVGRFSQQKDYKSLLKIWSIVHEKYPDWQLHIYGCNDFEEKVQNEWLSINIIAHKPTGDILDRYKKHSILLLTSKYEPFGLVLPEAMSCGLPVISFNCPYGPAEIITDGVDGFLIMNRDINVFANRVCQLIEDKELRVRMGQTASKSSQRYRAEVIMPKWKELFDSFIN